MEAVCGETGMIDGRAASDGKPPTHVPPQVRRAGRGSSSARYQAIIDGTPPPPPPHFSVSGDAIAALELASVDVARAGAITPDAVVDAPGPTRAPGDGSVLGGGMPTQPSEVGWVIDGVRGSPFGNRRFPRGDALGLTGHEGQTATISLTDMEKRESLIPPTTAHGTPLLKVSSVDIVVPVRLPSTFERAMSSTRRRREATRLLMRGLSFELGPGEVMCVMGPSGVGKVRFQCIRSTRRRTDTRGLSARLPSSNTKENVCTPPSHPTRHPTPRPRAGFCVL